MRLGAPAGWTLLRQRDYRRLWLAQTGSSVGDGFHSIAATWLIFDTLGGGPEALAVLGIAYVLPTLAFGVLSGTIVDRVDRRVVMVAADLVRAVLVGLLALLVWLGLATIPIVIVVGLGHLIASLFFNPARNAVLPAYVAPDDLVPANALMAMAYQSTSLLTPAIGGVLFAAIGPFGLLAIDALSFLWSALVLRGLTPGPALPGPAPRRPLLEEAADGLRFITGHPPSRLVVLVAAGNQLFAAGPYRTLVPAWIAQVLRGGAPEFGFLNSALSAGILLGNLVMSAIRAKMPLLRIVMIGVFVDGLTFLLFAVSPDLVLASLAFFALGASNGVLNAAYGASLQLTVPPDMRGRTFATFGTTMNLTSPISLAATGALAATLGPVVLISASGIGLMAVGALGLAAWLRYERATRLATA
jgi:hypothetical protein